MARDVSREGRGRERRETEERRCTETSSQTPARGWKDILLRIYRGISEDRILLIAAGVTFYALLAPLRAVERWWRIRCCKGQAA